MISEYLGLVRSKARRRDKYENLERYEKYKYDKNENQSDLTICKHQFSFYLNS